MKRRALIAAAPLVFVAACGLVPPINGKPVTLAQVKEWAQDLNNALHAAGQTFIASGKASPDQVTQTNDILAKLDVANTAVQNLTAPTSAREGVLTFLTLAENVSPLVKPYAGNAAPWIDVGINVFRAFVLSLPAPADSDHPPAALKRLAAARR